MKSAVLDWSVKQQQQPALLQVQRKFAANSATRDSDFMEQQKQQRKQRLDGNTVFVGKKPAMSYVLACVVQFNEGQKEVFLRARGRAISHAVDVAQIVKNKFLTDTEVKNVSLGTEIVKDESGQELNVSSIEICLGKK